MSLFLLQGRQGERYRGMMRRLWMPLPLVIAGLIITGIVQGASPSAVSTFHALYQQGKYEEALAELQKNPDNNASYYYDLGTVSFRLGKFGHSVAYLEKADRLQPGDEAIRSNLNLASTELARRLGNAALDPASHWTETIEEAIPLPLISGILGVLAFLSGLAWISAGKSDLRWASLLRKRSGKSFLILVVIGCAAFGVQLRAQAYPPAILIEASEIRSGPGSEFLELGRIEPGVKVRLSSRFSTFSKTQNGWRQVRYSAARIGWLKDSALLLL